MQLTAAGAAGTESETTLAMDALRRLVHGLRASSHVAERDVGVSGAQLFVLRELAEEPGISVRRLSERTLTDPSSVSVVVSRLVAEGLVTARRDEADARRSVLALTRRGQKLLGRGPEPYQARLIAALRAMAPTKLRRLRVALSEIVELVEPARGAAPLFFEEAPEKAKRSRRERH
jgi:DNA-binding MarR family transcriptional regulator